MPSKVAQPRAVIDSVRIAENCLHHTKEYIKNNLPATTSAFDDKFLCLKSENLYKMYKLHDFWEFLLAERKTDASNFNILKVIVTYHDSYFCKKKQFSTKKANK